MTQIIWDILKTKYPELPEDPSGLIEPGIEVEIEDGEKGILIGVKDGTATVITSEEVYDCNADLITATGRKMPVYDMVRDFIEGTDRKKPKHTYLDKTTGQIYDTVDEFCRDAGMSKSSAYKMLTGERETVMGHQLIYR